MVDIFWVVIVGWLSGRLINFLAEVLPNYRRIVRPVCVNCGQRQPLVKYLFWPRSCPLCGRRSPWWSWAIEMASVIFSVWLWYHPPDRLGYVGGMVLFIYLMVVLVIDIEHRLILHPVSIFGFLMGAGLGIWMHGLWDTLIGGASGFAVMLVFYYLGEGFIRFVARWKGETVNEVALGFGDVNLSGVLGLVLGWPGIVLGLILAVFLGGAYSLIYMVIAILTGRYRSFAAIPYGPFLVTSAMTLIYFRDILLQIL